MLTICSLFSKLIQVNERVNNERANNERVNFEQIGFINQIIIRIIIHFDIKLENCVSIKRQ